jgi:cytochrome c peroxidase
MPLFNLAWRPAFFWDGRAATLREQVTHPVVDTNELHETMSHVAAKLAATPVYPPLFAAAFGSTNVTPERIAFALEQYLLTLVAGGHSRFDRATRKELELTAEEKRGFELFTTEYDPRRGYFGADCFHCHGGALFTNEGFANNGLDPADAGDPGRGRVTGHPGDRSRFAVPSLRNITLTAPYMHDGRFATLDEVVAHYDHGVRPSPTLDPNLAKHPPEGLRLSDDDQRALVAFLKTLTEP